MIDHLMAFTNEATAKADPVVGAYWNSTAASWDMSQCIPNIFVWAPAQDVSNTTDGVITITHTPYDNLWRINIALSTQSNDLTNSLACELIADRNAANAGQPFILKANLTDNELDNLMIQPLFCGSNYPFGQAK